MLELYCTPFTVNSRKVLAGLALVDTPYNLHIVDFENAEHKSPRYLAINPNGTVPTAIDGDLTITESNAILQYAADQHSTAYPSNIKTRTQINTWLLWEAASWFPSCYVYLAEYAFKDEGEADESVIEAAAPKWHLLAGILESQLVKTKWLIGDEVTIADIAVAAPMHLYKEARLPLEKYPHLQKWLCEGIEKLSCWIETQEALNEAPP